MNSATDSTVLSPGSLPTEPIAAAIPVEITGSRVGEKSGQREMFTERTETVLLLANGAVIRLEALATPGQLLFLKNKDTSREVVARLVKYKKSASGGGYAELDFTESVPGFWGAHFKVEANRSRFPTSADGFRAASSQQAESSKAQDFSSPVSSASDAHSSRPEFVPPAAPKPCILTIEEAGKELLEQPAPAAPSIDDLNAEIAFLQRQLNDLRAAAGSGSEEKPSVAAGSGEEQTAVASALAKMLDTARGTPLSDLAPRGPSASETPKSAIPTGSVASALFSTPSGLAKPAMSSEDAMKALLSGSPEERSSDEAFPLPHYHVSPHPSGAWSRILIVAAVVFGAAVVTIGGYWYFYRSKTIADPQAIRLPSPGHEPAAPEGSVQQATTKESEGSAPDVSAGKDTPNTIAAPNPAASPESTARQLDSITTEDASESSEVQARSGRTAPKPIAQPGHRVTPASEETESSEIEPAKVLKTVRAMAPAQATREYVSGNVIIDAVVDATGHVASMNVVSGPEVLRKTAMDALKKWEYQPAMRNGKPVSSHVTAKIQFWYEP